MTDQVNAPAVSDPNPNNEDSPVGNTAVLLDVAAKPAVPKDEPKAQVAEGAVEYEATGDVGLDMALNFVGKAGIHMEHPAMQAAISGDFSLLKAELAAKGATGWEQFIALGEAAFSRTKEQEAAKTAALQNLIVNTAGGKEEWAAVQQWASSNATPEEKQQINALLNQGGLAAKGAVKYLVDAYGRANNVTVNPRDVAGNAGRAGGVPNADTGPLDPKAYSRAVGQLNIKLNGRLEGSPEYEALQRRRMAYRG